MNSNGVKTARGHLIPPQQHLYNALARPADYAIFAQEMDFPALQASRWHKTDTGRARQREGQSEKIMPRCKLGCCACGA